MEELAQFDIIVVHRAGKLHVNADALSIIPDTGIFCPNYRAGVSLSALPCYSRLNPCKVCTRTETRWTRFEDEVEFVVPVRLYVAYRLTFLLEVQIIGYLDTPKGI